MNFRTALGVAVTIVMTSASLLIPATAGAQETTTEASTEASAGQTATETPEKSTETTTAASTPDAQDPNSDSKSDPNKDLQDLSNDLSNNKDKDGSSITYDDKGAIESVGSVTTDTLKFIGAIIKVLAGVAGLMVLLGKAFPAVKDLIHNIARGGHL